MSDEGYKFPTEGTTKIPFTDVAKLRQALYDAKLFIAQGQMAEATEKIIVALDITTRWPV